MNPTATAANARHGRANPNFDSERRAIAVRLPLRIRKRLSTPNDAPRTLGEPDVRTLFARALAHGKRDVALDPGPRRERGPARHPSLRLKGRGERATRVVPTGSAAVDLPKSSEAAVDAERHVRTRRRKSETLCLRRRPVLPSQGRGDRGRKCARRAWQRGVRLRRHHLSLSRRGDASREQKHDER